MERSAAKTAVRSGGFHLYRSLCVNKQLGHNVTVWFSPRLQVTATTVTREEVMAATMARATAR